MSASTDLAVMLNHCIEEREELRELNAELLAELKFTLHLSEKESLDYFDDDRVRKVIAKAEAMKCSP